MLRLIMASTRGTLQLCRRGLAMKAAATEESIEWEQEVKEEIAEKEKENAISTIQISLKQKVDYVKSMACGVRAMTPSRDTLSRARINIDAKHYYLANVAHITFESIDSLSIRARNRKNANIILKQLQTNLPGLHFALQPDGKIVVKRREPLRDLDEKMKSVGEAAEFATSKAVKSTVRSIYKIELPFVKKREAVAIVHSLSTSSKEEVRTTVKDKREEIHRKIEQGKE